MVETSVLSSLNPLVSPGSGVWKLKGASRRAGRAESIEVIREVLTSRDVALQGP